MINNQIEKCVLILLFSCASAMSVVFADSSVTETPTQASTQSITALKKIDARQDAVTILPKNAGVLGTVFLVWEQAKTAMDQNDFETAEARYQFILNASEFQEFHSITRLKLAQAYIAAHKMSQALEVLKLTQGLSVREKGVYHEQLGDVYYFGVQDLNAAQEAYQEAKKNLQNQDSVISNQMRQIDLERLNLKISILNSLS